MTTRSIRQSCGTPSFKRFAGWTGAVAVVLAASSAVAGLGPATTANFSGTGQLPARLPLTASVRSDIDLPDVKLRAADRVEQAVPLRLMNAAPPRLALAHTSAPADALEPLASLVETPTKDFEAPAFREPETSEPARPTTRSNVRMRKPTLIEKSGSTKAKPDDEWRRRILQW